MTRQSCNKPPIPALLLPLNGYNLDWRTPRLRSTGSRTNSHSCSSGISVRIGLNDGSSCTSFTGLAGRCRLELKSDSKISSKSAKGGEGSSASACVCEDSSLASAEQTASDRKRTFRTAAVVRNRLEERRRRYY